MAARLIRIRQAPARLGTPIYMIAVDGPMLWFAVRR
jgi:hypothetical protein